jgi:hypothetical protein
MDAQIAEAYGSATWIVDRYTDLIAQLVERGDEIGLHVHFHRWSARHGDWLVDYTDARWVDECTRQALAAFASAFGRPCTTTHIGSWIDEPLLDLLDREGVRFDISLRPGQHPTRPFPGGGVTRGTLPALGGAPRSPYRPSRADLRRRDLGDALRLTLIPVTVAPLSLGWRPRDVARRARHAWLGKLRDWPPVVPAHMYEARPCPNSFAELLGRALATGVRHLAFINRSDFGVHALARVQSAVHALIERPELPRYVFTTPGQNGGLLTE